MKKINTFLRNNSELVEQVKNFTKDKKLACGLLSKGTQGLKDCTLN